jgi:hypothetical protein
MQENIQGGRMDKTMSYRDFRNQVNAYIDKINESYDDYVKKLDTAIDTVLDKIASEIEINSKDKEMPVKIHNIILSASPEFYDRHKDVYTKHWAKAIERIAKTFPDIKERWDSYEQNCQALIALLRSNAINTRIYEQSYIPEIRGLKLQDLLRGISKRMEAISKAKNLDAIKFAEAVLNIAYFSGKTDVQSEIRDVVSTNTYWQLMFSF